MYFHFTMSNFTKRILTRYGCDKYNVFKHKSTIDIYIRILSQFQYFNTIIYDNIVSTEYNSTTLVFFLSYY